jgi:hypothetical protein
MKLVELGPPVLNPFLAYYVTLLSRFCLKRSLRTVSGDTLSLVQNQLHHPPTTNCFFQRIFVTHQLVDDGRLSNLHLVICNWRH